MSEPRDIGSEGRALLTEREIEVLLGDESVSASYESKVRSEVKRRINSQLSKDVSLLASQHRDLWDELADAVGPIYYCPVCGEEFPRLNEVASHATGTTGDGLHDEIDTDRLKELAPPWWELWDGEGENA
ncbi:hypothetical protein ELS19_06210 [Halogeometricum borinquense]|uniref:C2H2-type domain-containing protein n=1 Tax=Halogeometricum borinquense TaxID=60847 RepID=A0A482T9P6_9EURY|nr:hypothetical protein [Halogeometricum borinquense]RYJ13587.1 hypothetical protein ELS19_06210 [Halogeometricum borinquense]